MPPIDSTVLLDTTNPDAVLNFIGKMVKYYKDRGYTSEVSIELSATDLVNLLNRARAA